MRIKKTSQYIQGGAILPSYFTNEIDTGMKWIDGSNIYRKVIEFGSLPDTTTKSVNHNISNLGQAITITGIATATTGNRLPLPFSHETNMNQCIRLYCNATQVIIGTGQDRSGYIGIVIMEYTKSS